MFRYSRLEFAREHFMFGTVSRPWFYDFAVLTKD